MCAFRITRSSSILFTALALGPFSAHAASGEITGRFTPSEDEQYEGYYYHQYQFSPASEESLRLIMASSSMDSYLILTTPDGEILTNDDHDIPGIERSGNDAGLEISTPTGGTWTAVLTTYGSGSTGSYTLSFEGITDLKRVDIVEVDPQSLESSFAARAVENQEAIRAQRISELTEQLTLPSFQATLEDSIRREMQEETGAFTSLSERRARLGALEEEERELLQAMRSAGTLTSSRELIQNLLQEKLESTRSRIDAEAAGLARTISEREAFRAALRELTELRRLSEELQALKDMLVSGDGISDLKGLRARIMEAQRQHNAVIEGMAVKLFGSEVVRHMRFGGSAILDYRGDLSMAMSGPGVFSARSSGPGFSDPFASARERARIDPSGWLPKMLPWPPPDASSRVVLHRNWLAQDGALPRTLGEVDEVLQRALEDAGYFGSGYWGVPSGFAIVTRLEQTHEDGVPLEGDLRWQAAIVEMKRFSLSEYIKALLTAPPGHFRVLVFVISSTPFSFSGERAALATIERWANAGVNVVPEHIRREELSPEHRVTALVYEFLKRRESDEPQTTIPGRLTAQDHLSRAKLAALVGSVMH